MQPPRHIDFSASGCYSNHMSNEELGERLRRFRLARGLSVRELARRSGINHATISLAERRKRWVGKPPSIVDVRNLAQALEVTVDQLLGDDNTPLPRRLLTDEELLDKIGAGYVEDIPLIDDVVVSAGPGSGVPQDIDDTLPRRAKRRQFKHLRTLVVAGHCLEPDLRPGDFVVIDRDRAPTPGKLVVAVRDEEEALIKRLVDRDGTWYLTTNDGHSDIPVDEHIRILGPVVAYQRVLW